MGVDKLTAVADKGYYKSEEILACNEAGTTAFAPKTKTSGRNVRRPLLLVKSSYRAEWNFPGGSVRPGETPDAAAEREMEEEIGLSSYPLLPAGSACGIWDGRRDRVHFFELHLDCIPELRLDNREIIAAHLVSPEDLHGIALTGAVAAYLGRDLHVPI